MVIHRARPEPFRPVTIHEQAAGLRRTCMACAAASSPGQFRFDSKGGPARPPSAQELVVLHRREHRGR